MRSVPVFQLRRVHPANPRQGNHRLGIGLVHQRAVVQLHLLGLLHGPIVLGLGEGIENAGCPGIARIIMTGVPNAIRNGFRRIVGGINKTTVRINELRIHLKGMPSHHLIGRVCSINEGFGVHVIRTNGKLRTGPPADVAPRITVHEVHAGCMHHGRMALKFFDARAP